MLVVKAVETEVLSESETGEKKEKRAEFCARQNSPALARACLAVPTNVVSSGWQPKRPVKSHVAYQSHRANEHMDNASIGMWPEHQPAATSGEPFSFLRLATLTAYATGLTR